MVYPTRTRDKVNVLIGGDMDEIYTGKLVDISGKVLSVTELPAHHNEISSPEFSGLWGFIPVIEVHQSLGFTE